MLTRTALEEYVRKDVGQNWVVMPQSSFSPKLNNKIRCHVFIQNRENLNQILEETFELDATLPSSAKAIVICTALNAKKKLLK